MSDLLPDVEILPLGDRTSVQFDGTVLFTLPLGADAATVQDALAAFEFGRELGRAEALQSIAATLYQFADSLTAPATPPDEEGACGDPACANCVPTKEIP